MLSINAIGILPTIDRIRGFFCLKFCLQKEHSKKIAFAIDI